MDEEPTVLPVVPAHPELGLERNARGQSLIPLGLETIGIVGVDDRPAKDRRAQFLQPATGVLDEDPIRVHHLAVHVDHRDGLRDRVRDPSQLRFRLPQRFQGSLPADRDLRDLSRALDQLDLGLRRLSRLGRVERERTEQLTLLGENRLRPRGPDPVLDGELARIVGPDRIARDVLDDDPLPEVRRGSAAALVRPDRPGAEAWNPAGRNTRTRGMPQVLCLWIHQQDGRVDGGALRVDGATELVQCVLEARPVRDHLQRPPFRDAQRLCVPRIVDDRASVHDPARSLTPAMSTRTPLRSWSLVAFCPVARACQMPSRTARSTSHAASRTRRLDRVPVRVGPVFFPHQTESTRRTTARYGTYEEAPGNDADEDTFARHFELDVVALDEHALERGRDAADLDRSSPAPVRIGQFDGEGGPLSTALDDAVPGSAGSRSSTPSWSGRTASLSASGSASTPAACWRRWTDRLARGW